MNRDLGVVWEKATESWDEVKEGFCEDMTFAELSICWMRVAKRGIVGS